MSTEKNSRKDVVRAFFKALGAGDVEAMGKVLDPTVQAVATGTSFTSCTRNYDEVLSALGMLRSMAPDGIDFEILELTGEDDRVSAEVQGRSTLVNGAPYNNQYHMLFYIPDGRITRIKEYFCTKLTDESFGPIIAAQQG